MQLEVGTYFLDCTNSNANLLSAKRVVMDTTAFTTLDKKTILSMVRNILYF
jgi:hypothetical protein